VSEVMLKNSREEQNQESELSEEVIAGRFVSRCSDESERVINLEILERIRGRRTRVV
jgi:hypothetical protein